MAVNYGSTNTNRYHTVADSDDFNLPNGNWSWIVIFNPSVGGAVFPYFLSHGGTFGGANTVHLFNNGASGFACAVAGLSSRNWGGGNMSSYVGKWMVGYGARRAGNLYCAAAPVNEPWNAFESAGVAISAAYTPANALKIGIRADLSSDATYSTKSRISDAIYVPGYGFSLQDLRNLVSGGLARLENEPWWNLRVFHAQLKTSNDERFGDLTGRHEIVRNGTGYSTDESELFEISRDPSRDRNRIWAPLFAAGVGADLAGTATGQASSTGNIATEIPLAGASVIVATATAAISTSIDLSAVAASTATAAGGLDASVGLEGQAAAEASASAGLTTTITLSGDAVVQALASAGVDTNILFNALASGEATASGDLSGAPALQGDATTQSSAAGALDTAIALAGDATNQATADGDLAGSASLQSDAFSSTDSSATLTTQIILSGTAVAEALATGSLDAGALLASDAVAQSSATGNITTDIPLLGDITAMATGAGDLSTGIELNGVAISQAYASGDLYISLALSGDAAAYVLAGATLTTQLSLSADALANAMAAGFLDGAARSTPQNPLYTVKAPVRNYRVAA